MNPVAATSLDLRDIHAAAPPALWPPAPGWWVLAGVSLIVLGLLIAWLLRRYAVYHARKQILGELDAISHCNTTDSAADCVSRLSGLMRRLALQRYSRERVASLTGRDWLRFLDATGGGGEFEHGAGRILESGPYQPQQIDHPAEALLTLTRRWVTHNLKGAT